MHRYYGKTAGWYDGERSSQTVSLLLGLPAHRDTTGEENVLDAVFATGLQLHLPLKKKAKFIKFMAVNEVFLFF